jgi:hypothetical protein
MGPTRSLLCTQLRVKPEEGGTVKKGDLTGTLRGRGGDPSGSVKRADLPPPTPANLLGASPMLSSQRLDFVLVTNSFSLYLATLHRVRMYVQLSLPIPVPPAAALTSVSADHPLLAGINSGPPTSVVSSSSSSSSSALATNSMAAARPTCLVYALLQPVDEQYRVGRATGGSIFNRSKRSTPRRSAAVTPVTRSGESSVSASRGGSVQHSMIDTSGTFVLDIQIEEPTADDDEWEEGQRAVLEEKLLLSPRSSGGKMSGSGGGTGTWKKKYKTLKKGTLRRGMDLRALMVAGVNGQGPSGSGDPLAIPEAWEETSSVRRSTDTRSVPLAYPAEQAHLVLYTAQNEACRRLLRPAPIVGVTQPRTIIGSGTPSNQWTGYHIAVVRASTREEHLQADVRRRAGIAAAASSALGGDDSERGEGESKEPTISSPEGGLVSSHSWHEVKPGTVPNHVVELCDGEGKYLRRRETRVRPVYLAMGDEWFAVASPREIHLWRYSNDTRVIVPDSEIFSFALPPSPLPDQPKWASIQAITIRGHLLLVSLDTGDLLLYALSPMNKPNVTPPCISPSIAATLSFPQPSCPHLLLINAFQSSLVPGVLALNCDGSRLALVSCGTPARISSFVTTTKKETARATYIRDNPLELNAKANQLMWSEDQPGIAV